MIGQLVLWGLLTGGTTGGAWVGIVLVSRYRRLHGQALDSLARLEERLEVEEANGRRLAEVEERLAFAERLLAQQTQEKLPRPSDD